MPAVTVDTMRPRVAPRRKSMAERLLNRVLTERTSFLARYGGSGGLSSEIDTRRLHFCHGDLAVRLVQVHRSDCVGYKRHLEALLKGVENGGFDAVVGGQTADIQVPDAVVVQEIFQRPACFVARLKRRVGVFCLA